MSTRTSLVRAFLADEEGATMVEYGIMVALIAAVCIAILISLGTKVQTEFTTLDSSMP